jgi:hypothetical protein
VARANRDVRRERDEALAVSVGIALEAHRAERHALTQSELADLAGLPAAAIDRCENGQKDLSYPR